MSPITTHVLDTSIGKPAQGVPVKLEFQGKTLAERKTDADGRVKDLLDDDHKLVQGTYRLTFEIKSYFARTFYPSATIEFEITDPSDHYHVPLLVSGYGYSTYRGS